MKTLVMTLTAFFAIAYASAQNDPKSDPPAVMIIDQDSTSTNTQLQKESDVKTMDAVKTNNHTKATPEVAVIKKDSINSKNKRTGKKTTKP